MNPLLRLPSPATRTTGPFRNRAPRPTSVCPAAATVDKELRSPEVNGPDAFHLYLRDIGKLPLLTPKEEIALARCAQRGDVIAREELIKGNLRLVVRIAREYEHMGLPLLDLIAEGNIGLMKAVDRFDPTRGVKLSVYAGYWIKQCMRRALGNHSRTIRLPIHVHEELTGLERAANRLREVFGRPPTDDELAHEAGLSHAHLSRLRRSMLSFTSLDAPLSDGATHPLAEMVADEQMGTPYEHLSGDTMRELLRHFLGELRPREVFVLRLRYGLDGEEELTLEEVAQRMDVTRERVRQIQKAAIKKLCVWMRKREAGSWPTGRIASVPPASSLIELPSGTELRAPKLEASLPRRKPPGKPRISGGRSKKPASPGSNRQFIHGTLTGFELRS